MYGQFTKLQLDKAVRGQPDYGFGVFCREVHGGFPDSPAELPVLLAESSQCPVQFMFGNVPCRTFSIDTMRLVSPQYQCARNKIVRPVTPCDNMFLEQIVVAYLYPCPVCIDPVNHLSVQCDSHDFSFEDYIKSMSTSSLFLLYFRKPLLECRSRSMQRSPYICSKES